MRKSLLILATIITLVFISVGIKTVVDSQSVIKDKEFKILELETTNRDLRINVEKLNKGIETSEEKVKNLENEKAELEEKKKQLEAEKISKQENAQRIAQSSKLSQQASASSISGNKHTWLVASGIPESDWKYVDYIVGRESGWNPCAYNPGKSDCNANPTSACGLAQSLPCGKQSKYGHWTDPVANLKWQYEYVKGRYGGYAQAYNFWLVNKWY